MIKMLRPEDVWQPRLGAPRGNRNAHKHGRSDAAMRALRARIAAFRRSARAALKEVAEEVAARRKPVHGETPHAVSMGSLSRAPPHSA